MVAVKGLSGQYQSHLTEVSMSILNRKSKAYNSVSIYSLYRFLASI